jgi:hypothetical protein
VEAEPGADSTIRAWTYTLDGHTFYVLDLGEEGTFKYDKVTGEWSKHITSGYDTQWNVINGTMWGHRIVGGDLIRFDMWEVDPLVLTDNTRGIEFEFATTDVSTGSDTITEATHGLNTGDGPVQFSSTDTLPGGLFSGAGSLYWVIRVDANTLKVASTQLNAYLGTAIDLTSVGVGTHTLTTYDLQIAHAATGGLQGRSRSKVGVGALLVTGSSGTLNNVDGSELRLRWSDNNGASFSNTMTVALTSGGYTTDVSFRSLGSFAAPGRVFELSDTGGPKRLDSAWADIPEIDNVPSR